MLTDEEKHEIEAEAGHYPTKRAACVEAMNCVQRRRGWVSDEALREVADLLEMTPAELDGIATFYNLIFRKPVGRHVLLLCDSISCWVTGQERLQRHLKQAHGLEMGLTTADGRLTLLPIVCLGACDRAPAMMVDGDLHGPVSPENVGQILERYR